MRSWANDWLDPSEVGRFRGEPVTGEIRATLGLQDEDSEDIDSSEPLPEDTVAVIKDYQIGPGDLLEVTIHELIRAGSILTEARRVSNLGNISLPILGRINVNGLTEQQTEDLIKAKLKPGLLPDPIVTVVVRIEQQRHFNIVGFAARAGSIPIPRSDYRIIEALSHAGTIPEEVEKVYVIRRSKKSESETPGDSSPDGETSAPASSQPAVPPTSTGAETSRGLWEDTDLLLDDMSAGQGRGSTTRNATSSSKSPAASRPVKISAKERAELLEAIVPGSDDSSKSVTSSAKPTSTSRGLERKAPGSPEKGLSKWIWLNGDWVELRGEQTEQASPKQDKQKPERPATTEAAPSSEPSSTLEWEAIADAGDETRVISIPLKPLHAGEARYNIVVYPGDVISIPAPEAGKRYYMTGHVRGPGAFMIPVGGITLKAAIASAGGLDEFAWPTRCEIARKIGPDQEVLHQINLDRIFAMKDDDIKIKAGDIINIGTHPLSPFLVSISRGFRTTYGFGFVYDRNFGTIDSYGAQQNPTDRRRNEQQSRFPSLQSAFPGL